MKKIILLITLVLNLLTVTYAAESFVVKKIEINGVQRISTDTVYSYLPIRAGNVLRPGKTTEIMKALYDTGFFEHITLARHGDTLVINVVERPTIGLLRIIGNSIIPKDKLTEVMSSVDVAEGRVYDAAVLDKIKQSLLNQYYQLGRYNARVSLTVNPMDRNRVCVSIVISEGLLAKIRRINFIGNHAFNTRTLANQLRVTTPGLLTFFSQTDRYTEEKLQASLTNLRNFYLDRGYIKFEVKSSQVMVTPDRKSILLTIVVDEGVPYKVKGVALEGDLILPRSELMTLVTTKPGDIFSRQAFVETEKAITDALGNKGYIFTEVELIPNIDDVKKEVFVTLDVKPGKRTYVRHIYFTDNNKTNDGTLRRELEQMESAMVSTKLLQQSKLRLTRQAYLKEVDMSVIPVPGTDDQVDINYKVKEDNAAQANVSIGYSRLDHVILSAGLTQKNFLGTGNTVGLNLSRSRYQSYYGIDYVNPYFTQDGISRSLSFNLSQFNPKNANLSSSYSSSQYQANDVYGIPFGQEEGVFNRALIGYGYEGSLITLNQGNNTPISGQVNDFVTRNGRHFQQLDLITGISRDSRNKGIFPTSGMLHSLSATIFLPVTNNALKYYNLAYDTKWYYPLTDKFITLTKGTLGYGSSFNGGAKNYPFFKNFYLGGIGTMPGYAGNSLGPKDSNFDPTGGNLLINLSFGLIFPNYVSDNLRTDIFIDGGNVYNTFDNRNLGGTASGHIRTSCGIEAGWLSPMGLIDVSLAKAINPIRARQNQPGRLSDDEQVFDFSLGANFG
ncbi:MAG: bamA [Gammaproteobacteria bacterium]|jgi:outer membrane protein insertion porin family|nr:bamA [Gammaproteobacteria bacterium]